MRVVPHKSTTKEVDYLLRIYGNDSIKEKASLSQVMEFSSYFSSPASEVCKGRAEGGAIKVNVAVQE